MSGDNELASDSAPKTDKPTTPGGEQALSDLFGRYREPLRVLEQAHSGTGPVPPVPRSGWVSFWCPPSRPLRRPAGEISVHLTGEPVVQGRARADRALLNLCEPEDPGRSEPVLGRLDPQAGREICWDRLLRLAAFSRTTAAPPNSLLSALGLPPPAEAAGAEGGGSCIRTSPADMWATARWRDPAGTRTGSSGSSGGCGVPGDPEAGDGPSSKEQMDAILWFVCLSYAHNVAANGAVAWRWGVSATTASRWISDSLHCTREHTGASSLADLREMYRPRGGRPLGTRPQVEFPRAYG